MIVGILYVKKSGGSEKALIKLLENLSSNFEVGLYIISNKTLIEFNNKKTKIISSDIDLIKVLKLSKLTIVFDMWLGLKISIYKPLLKFKIIISERANPLRYNLLDKLKIFLLVKLFNPILVTQSYSAQQIFKKLYISTKKISNFLLIKNEIGKTTKNFNHNILIMSRLVEEKGFKNLEKVLLKLLEIDRKLNFTVLGNGEIKKWTKNKNILKKIKHLKYQDNIEKHYTAGSILLSLSPLEGFPNVILEAMSLGLPIITPQCTNVLYFLLPEGNLILKEWSQLNDKKYIKFINNYNNISHLNYLESLNYSSKKIYIEWLSIIQKYY